MRFYHLEPEPIAKRQIELMDALQADGTIRGDAPRCEACGDFIGMRPWLPPYRVELDVWGSEFGDLAFPTADDLLVSLRFKELWEQHGFIGLSGFEPVEVVKVRRHRKFQGAPPPYFKAAVVLSKAVVDDVASGVEETKPPTCPVCRLGSGIKRWKAIIIKPETWSGEDVFQPRWSSGFFTTERFKEWCEINNMKNATFIPAEEYGYDYYPWEKQAK
jgi:hypothetical protein